jgi:cytochrome P450
MYVGITCNSAVLFDIFLQQLMKSIFIPVSFVPSEWTEDDLVAQAVIFLLGGFETVSSVITFALHELAIHPEVQEKLVKEIKEYEVKTKGQLDYNSLQGMQYMEMVLSGIN